MGKQARREFFSYALIGISSIAFDLTVFYILLFVFFQDPIFSTVIGYLSGTLLSFSLNRLLTFRVMNRFYVRMVLFFLTAITGALISASLVFASEFFFQIDPSESRLWTIPPVAVFQFLINKTITFREDKIN